MARVGEYYDGGRRGGREVYGKERKKTASEMHPPTQANGGWGWGSGSGSVVVMMMMKRNGQVQQAGGKNGVVVIAGSGVSFFFFLKKKLKKIKKYSSYIERTHMHGGKFSL